MSEKLQKIEIVSVDLIQYKSLLYQILVHTTARDNAYEYDRVQRCEEERDIANSSFFDSFSPYSVITNKLTSVQIIEASKQLKQFFDARNEAIERINGSADDMRETVKSSLKAIFEMEVIVK